MAKYKKHDLIRHDKGTVYRVIFTPDDNIRLEACGSPAYGYLKSFTPVGEDNPVWFRAQALVEEEERFTLHVPEKEILV